MVLLFKPLPVKDHYVVYCDKFSQGRVIRTAKLLGKGPWQREHRERGRLWARGFTRPVPGRATHSRAAFRSLAHSTFP